MGKLQIQHIYREGNQLADYIANLAFAGPNIIVFNTFKELPSHARRIAIIEKQQIPTFRFKTNQISQQRKKEEENITYITWNQLTTEYKSANT